MIDKKTVAILTLLALVTVMGIGWFWTGSKPERVLPLPPGIENWTQYFPGYEAYLDNDIYAISVSGPSMEPALGNGDLALWVKANPENLKVNDIVLMYYQLPWRTGPENVVHRIIDIDLREDGYHFLTKGDNNSKNDGWVPEDSILGLVIGVIYSGS